MRYIPGQTARPQLAAALQQAAEYEVPPQGPAAQAAAYHQQAEHAPQYYGQGCAEEPACARRDDVNARADGHNSDDERGPAWRPASFQSEFEFVNHLWRQRKWQVVQMRGDGACLFRSIAYHVYGDQEMHDQVRRMCMDYMAHNPDHFAEFVVGESFADYVARKRHEHEHGNHLEIQAMSEMYSRCIEVYELSDEPLNIFQAHCTADAPIRLLYRHGHYDAIVDPARPAFGVGLGFADLKPGEADRQLLAAAEDESVSQVLVDSAVQQSAMDAADDDITAAVIAQSLAEFEESLRRRT